MLCCEYSKFLENHKMLNPLVSVILPTYNREYFLQRAINSVLSQTYKNIELIVIDDGSTDNTIEILDGYGDKLQYRHQKNAGVSSARNNGIRLAKGAYIAFIDSDDIWRRNKLELQMAYFAKYPEIALCFTNVSMNHEDGSTSKKYEVLKHTKNEIYGLKEVLIDPYFGLPTVVVKRNILDDSFPFDETLKTAEDLNLFLNVALNHKVGYLHNILADIYVTTGSLSVNVMSFEDNIFVLTRFIEKNTSACNNIGFDINEALFNINYEYAKSLLWNGHNKAARPRIFIAAKYKSKFSLILLFLKSYIVRK